MRRNWKNRLHIVGLAQRTGTTLMSELIGHGFRIDGFIESECQIHHIPPGGPYELLCTKIPTNIHIIRKLLDADPTLWVICMLRDPRDIVVSRHGSNTTIFWTNLRIVREGVESLRKLKNHPRALLVRYEELAEDPDRVQKRIADFMPALEFRASFSSFGAEPSAVSQSNERALRGIRQVNPSSIGAWRRNPERLAAQIAMHGPIGDILRELGYERDDAWLEALAGVHPDNGRSEHAEHADTYARFRRRLRWWSRTTRYRLGLFKVNRRVSVRPPAVTCGSSGAR